jgi:hypothetical protein
VISYQAERRCGWPREQPLEILGRPGPPKEVALHLLAARFAQKSDLIGPLDTFGRDHQVEAMIADTIARSSPSRASAFSTVATRSPSWTCRADRFTATNGGAP